MGHTEFYPQLNRLRDAEADVLVSIFTPLSSGVALVKQFNELAVGALHIAIYYPSRPEFLQQVGEEAEGLLWSPLILDPKHTSAHQAFAGRIQERFEVEATIDHAYGYDAIYNAIDSIGRADSLEPREIIDAVASLDHQGIIGRYVFDVETHQARVGPEYIAIPIAQIQNGENWIVWPGRLATTEYQPQPWVE